MLQPGPGACLGHVGAGKAAAQDVNGLNLRPVHDGQVSEVRNTGEPVRQDLRRAGGIVGYPGQLAAEQVTDGHFDAAVAAAT